MAERALSRSPLPPSRTPFTGSRAPMLPGSVAPFKDVTRKASPERWDVPFGADMTEKDVDRVLTHPLFISTRADRFPTSIPLRGILKNDTRVRRFQHGELIVRQGDYGHSAFVILSGAVRVMLKEPAATLLGRQERKRPSLFGSVGRWLRRSHFPEQATTRGGVRGLRQGDKGEIRIF